ncbi:ATP-binding protein [Halocola ammonii]
MSIGKLNNDQLNILHELLHEYGRGNFDARISYQPEDESVKSIVASLNTLGRELARESERKEQKTALLHEIYEQIDEIIYALKVDYNPKPTIEFNFISKQISELLGYPEDAYINDIALRKKIIHPDDRKNYKSHLTKALEGERSRFDYRLKINNSDSYMWLEDQLIPKIDHSGKVIAILGCARDITSRKTQEMDVKYAFREIKLIDQINSAALRGKSVKHISDLLLDSLRKITGVMSSRFYIFDTEETTLKLNSENIAKHLRTTFQKATGYDMEVDSFPVDHNHLLNELIGKRTHLITSDPSEIEQIIHSHYKKDTDKTIDAPKIRRSLKIKTMGLLPMVVEDELLGVATFTAPKVISAFEKESISRFINHVSFALAKQRSEEKVHEQKKFFESILHNAPGQIAVISDKGKFSFINKQAVKNDELRNWLIGKDDFDYCKEKNMNNDLAHVRQEMYQKAITSKTVTEWVDEHTDKNGEKIYILRKYIPLFENGEFQYIVGNGINITAIKEAEHEKEKLIKDLNDRINELMQFNYIVSHNLRSPVANMLGLSKLIGMDLPREKKDLIAEKMKESAESLDNIIRDLSQVLSARTPINKKVATFSLIEVLEEIKNNLENQIADSGSIIRMDICPDADKMKTIKSYVQSIMFNLISNAIKYRHPDKKCVIEVSAERKGQFVIIEVSDNGLGIDIEKYGEEVFKLYKRFHDHVKGTGIGLHLTKIQTEVLGGQIEIDSKVDMGTRFRLTIPS